MKVIRHLAVNKNGELNKTQLKEFGGRFNLIEKLRIGGTGSPKIIYLGGIRVLDLLVREIEGETAFVSFEVLRNGLILRMNINQRKVCVGIHLNNLRNIKIRNEVDIIQILERTGNFYEFSVPLRERKAILTFFKKKVFSELLVISNST